MHANLSKRSDIVIQANDSKQDHTINGWDGRENKLTNYRVDRKVDVSPYVSRITAKTAYHTEFISFS